MALFDGKNWNPEVFETYVGVVENLNRNELLKSGALVEKPQYAASLAQQTGGNYIIVPIKARIGGTPVNYDGNTNIDANSRKTYTHGRVVVGRANAWSEMDFSADITGEDFMPAATEVAEYWDDVDQKTLLAILAGIFSMSGEEEFTEGHTYDISEKEDATFGSTTLNLALQKALGDNKSKFSLAIMHSAVSTDLENLNLLEHLKYTDANGIERELSLGTVNGRLVLIDDAMPVLNGYFAATSATTGALKVVASDASTGEVNLADVTGSDFYPAGVAANDYVLPGIKHVTYVFGNGAIEYTDCGVKKPYEMDRDPKTNGGVDLLYSRQRKIFAPLGISWKANSGIVSPTDVQLATGSYWEIANSNEDSSPVKFPHKAIPIARIISQAKSDF